MKTITIPSMYTPYLEVFINGAKRQFPAGQTITVDDDVASIIENAMRNVPARREPVPPIIPEDGTPGQVLTKTETGYVWADLPKATDSTLGVVKGGNNITFTAGGIAKVAEATTNKAGAVKKAIDVPDATEDDILQTLNLLLTNLRYAGIIDSSDSLSMTPPPAGE